MINLRTTLAATLAALSINAHAIGVPTDGSWIEFDFDATGSSIYDLTTWDTNFDFSLGQESVVRVVDLGLAGDRFAAVAKQRFGNTLRGRLVVTAGLGGMGGAQPLAATMAGASMLAVECQPSRIEMRLRTRYLDARADTLDEALAMLDAARRDGRAVSVGLLGNAAEIFPELFRRGIRPDAVTDQTSAHDPVNGYLPAGWSLDHWLGISPWGMIVFLLVGFAAGVLNVMRAAGVVPEPGAKDRDA